MTVYYKSPEQTTRPEEENKKDRYYELIDTEAAERTAGTTHYTDSAVRLWNRELRDYRSEST